MISNFKSDIFDEIWIQNFLSHKRVKSFSFIKDIIFYKHPFLPLYTNVGKRLTPGKSYATFPRKKKDNKNAVQLIYDVPRLDSFSKQQNQRNNFKTLSSFQYKAYAVDLRKYMNIEDYLKNILSGNNRYQIRRALKRFNHSFDIKFKSFLGPKHTEHEYKDLIEKFFTLFDKSYKVKGQRHVFQQNKNRQFMTELLIQLLSNEEAVIFGIYADEELISLNLNYITENSLTLVLPLYDPDYSRFKVGHISTYYTLKWCLNHGIDFYDFSKGHFDYKKQWSNLTYEFDYHLIFNNNSPISMFVAYILYSYFELKSTLRLAGFDSLLKRLISSIKKKPKTQSTYFEVEECQEMPEGSKKIILEDEMHYYSKLKKIKNRFLFDNQEINSKTKCFIVNNQNVFIQGEKKSLLLKPI